LKTLPDELNFIRDKLLIDDPDSYEAVSTIISKHIKKAIEHNRRSESFCDTMLTPKNISDELIKYFGVSDNGLINSFDQIGFKSGDKKMFHDTYYLSLLTVLYIASVKDDRSLQEGALTLILLRLYNGRKRVSFKKVCIEEIAKYVESYKLRSSNNLLKHGSVLNAIINHFVPTILDKYIPTMLSEPSHPRYGIISLFTNSWSRIKQFMIGLARQYYDAYENGQTSLISKNRRFDDSEEISEKIVTSAYKIDAFVDSVQHQALVTRQIFRPGDVRYITERFSLNKLVVVRYDEYLINTETSIFKSLVGLINMSDKDVICGMNPVAIGETISKMKSHKPEYLRFIGDIEKVMFELYGDAIVNTSRTQILKIRKALILLSVLAIKKLVCGANCTWNGCG
jgi:hypothetical protein